MALRNDDGFSLIELLIVMGIILVLAAIAIPALLRARISANEASAVEHIRSITTAQLSYITQYPDVGYATSLDKLGTGTGTPDSDHAGLLPSYLTISPYEHSGYVFIMTGTAGTYNVSAVPIHPGSSGTRSFCADTPTVIFVSPTESGCTIGVNALQ